MMYALIILGDSKLTKTNESVFLNDGEIQEQFVQKIIDIKCKPIVKQQKLNQFFLEILVIFVHI